MHVNSHYNYAEWVVPVRFITRIVMKTFATSLGLLRSGYSKSVALVVVHKILFL
jgi:hypothetical protein